MSLLQWARTSQRLWCVVLTLVVLVVTEVVTLNGSNVCMVQQKYNITKRVKYRAPMSVRTYEWCFAMPPRCSKWSTEMRERTRLETEERTAEVAVCCPGYKMKDVSCVPICPSGKMGNGCSEDCPPDKWGPNCVNECPECFNGFCVPSTGECDCEEGWQGESCEVSMSTVQAAPALMEELLTTTKSTIKTLPTTVSTVQTTKTTVSITVTSKPTTVISLLTKPITSINTSTQKPEITTTLLSNLLTKPTSFFKYTNTTTTPSAREWSQPNTTEKVPKTTVNSIVYNRTEISEEGTSMKFTTEHVFTMKVQKATKSSTTPLTSFKIPTTTATSSTSSNTPITSSTTPLPTTSTTSIPSTTMITNVISTSTISPEITIPSMTDIVMETTKMFETTTKSQPTTIKFKPKEIWIRPTQKGDPTIIETKVKNYHELSHTKIKSATYKIESTAENTTPKTIIVSIIPTSVSHATFKKIALTTAAYLPQKTNATMRSANRTEQGFTKSMTPQVSTAIPITIKFIQSTNTKNLSFPKTSTRLPQSNKTFKITPSTNKVFVNTFMTEKHRINTKAISNTTMATSMTTNSMLSTLYAVTKKLNSSTLLITKSTNKQHIHKSSFLDLTTVSVINKNTTKVKQFVRDEAITKKVNANENVNVKVAKTIDQEKKYKQIGNEKSATTNIKQNVTKTTANTVTTQEPSEDETFHILTEPEHITAVMNDKERDHTSVDLISVISIAGGVMMAVITVAVVIVMIERCRRPRYEDVRKINDIRMQVMIDNSDVPPPYVRSIFHTPLPDPPTSERCHYQPISTLDRNLKQFMRPVVVQTISPVMLENFRGILECHYDHLPRRNHGFGTMPARCSVSPSMKCDDELLHQRPLSVADYTIEALKCEAKMDMIDTSEPLYAEIPCWRPPSEHAIEVLNLNGEAVTEL